MSTTIQACLAWATMGIALAGLDGLKNSPATYWALAFVKVTPFEDETSSTTR